MNTTSQRVNQMELEKFFAGIGSRMAQEGASSQLPDRRHLNRFFSAVVSRIAIAEKKQQQLDREEATRFNVFHFIHPGENKLSDILADLLDPKGDHGQGDLFLRLLFKQLDLGSDAKLTKGATVHREAPTHGILKYLRRMDVLVEAGMLLAIENKVDSIDQLDQVKDYLEHLQRCKRGNSKQSILIYLTPNGRTPKSLPSAMVKQQEACGQLRCWSYQKNLRSWLESCHCECRAEKIRFFLTDFITHIETKLRRCELEAEENEDED